MKDLLLGDCSQVRAFFMGIAENSLLPVFLVKSNGEIFHVNAIACKYLEYTEEELLRLNVADIDPTIEPEFIDEAFDYIKKSKVIKVETKLKKKSGTVVDVEIVGNYFEFEGTGISLSYVFDISDRKKKEDSLERIVRNRTKALEQKIIKLQETESRLRVTEEMFINTFKTSRDAVAINRLSDGLYLEINSGFTESLGYTPEDVKDKTSIELRIWKDLADRDKLIQELTKNGISRDLEAEFIHKDGTVVPGLMSASIQDYFGEKVILSVSKDISKLKKLEKELKALNFELQDRVEKEAELRQKQDTVLIEQRRFADMGQMISAIAHQWRQPLNNINLIAQAMKEIQDGVDLGITFDELYENHADLTNHMSETIDDFRNFFSPKKTKTRFSIVKELFITMELLKAQFESKNIQTTLMCSCSESSISCKSGFVTSYCNKGNDIVEGYPGEIRQVFLNILINAKDAILASASKRKDAKRTISVTVKVSDDSIKMEFCNRGEHIPGDVLPKIFDPYFSTKGEGKGTGIGLYMSRLIVEDNMDGKISCTNTDNGVCFTLFFNKPNKLDKL